MRYFVRIGDREVEVLVDGEAVTIGDDTTAASLEAVVGSPVHVLRTGSGIHRVVAQRGDQRGRYTVWVAGHRLEVEALDERARAIRQLGAAARASGPAHLHAPMPGLIVRVTVAEGDAVAAGQGVVVMEAMKMENELRAPAAGIVKRVLVKPGTAVEKGAMLLELANAP